MDAVGVGALNIDLIYEVPGLEISGERFEPEAEVVMEERSFDQLLRTVQSTGTLKARTAGGSAANTMYALDRFGFSTSMLGVVGKDEDAAFLLGEMKGVDVKRIKRYKRTGSCLSLISKADQSFVVVPASNDMFAFTEEDVEHVNQATVVHMTSFAGDNSLGAQKRLLEKLDENISVTFSPGELYARRGLKQIAPLISRSAIVFLTEREIGLLTGQEKVEGARTIIKMGPTMVACMLGEQGSSIVTKNNEMVIPSKRTKVVDRTSAGDIYSAGFIAGMLGRAPLEMCGEIGTAAAALSIASYGREGYPDERFLRQYLKKVG